MIDPELDWPQDDPSLAPASFTTNVIADTLISALILGVIAGLMKYIGWLS